MALETPSKGVTFIRSGSMPSPAVLRSNAVVEPLEERGRGGRCAAAAGVEREKHFREEPCHLWDKVAHLASREDLLVAVKKGVSPEKKLRSNCLDGTLISRVSTRKLANS
ncbi:MAG TPA: hypothetical protein VF043_10890 [Ktedonobacteraceae bacterium]